MMIAKVARKSVGLLGLLVPALVFVSPGSAAAPGRSPGIVESVIKAPVTADGDVAGARTDLVVNLAGDMNPAVDGRSLLAGDTIKVTLPDDFVPEDPPLPFQRALVECQPSSLACNTGVLLQGWPQRPVPPPLYTISLEGTHTVVFTADVDIIPRTGPTLAGIKQMHLMLSGYANPGPGRYDIAVAAETGPGGATEYGTGRVRILSQARPSVNVMSVFNPGVPNSIYQTTAAGTPTALSFDLLLWGRLGVPLEGVELDWKRKHGLLRFGGQTTAGRVRVQAPPGATGYRVTSPGASSLVNAPVFGNPAGHMAFNFEAASSGAYVISYRLNGGNEVRMYVTVTD